MAPEQTRRQNFEPGHGAGTQAFAVNDPNAGPTNNDPVVVDDSVTTDEDTPVTISVLTNDSDPDFGDWLAQNIQEIHHRYKTENSGGE